MTRTEVIAELDYMIAEAKLMKDNAKSIYDSMQANGRYDAFVEARNIAQKLTSLD